MSDQQYCLRWNNHHPNFVSVFKTLLEFEELVDVTISTEGQRIRAHKVILSACSPYFRMLFTEVPCKHPVIILSDIKYIDLKTIIEFMYCGEINVPDERLADILEVAEALQIRGLFDPSKMGCTNRVSSHRKRKRKSESVDQSDVNLSDTSQQSFEANYSEKKSYEMFDPTDWLKVEEQPHNYFNEPSQSSSTVESPRERFKNCVENTLSNHLQHNSSSGVGPGPVRKRNTKVQESENFLLALEAVRSGSLGFCKAAKLYGLNNRTLWLEYKKRGYPTNRPPVNIKHRQNALPENPS